MAATTQIVEGLWQVNLGAVNAFLLDQGELTLVDTGMPKSEEKIAAAIQFSLGYEDLALGQRALSKLMAFDFDIAVFGHGNALMTGAVHKFREVFA